MTTTPSSSPAGEPAEPLDWDAEEEAVEAADRRRTGDRRWWWIGGTAVLVLVVMAVVWGVSATAGRVHWVDTGFQVVSDEQVDVRFDLRRDADRAVVCRLEAQDASHVVVGRTDVTVEGTDTSPSRHISSVRTAAPAITGYVDECWYADEAPRHTGG